jgi:hypothetical protein
MVTSKFEVKKCRLGLCRREISIGDFVCNGGEMADGARPGGRKKKAAPAPETGPAE